MGRRLAGLFAVTIMFTFAFGGFSVANAATASSLSDADLTKAIQGQFPNAKVISKTECELGKKKVKVIGAVIQKRSAEENPLDAVIVQTTKGVTTVTALSKKIENSNGLDNDFLHDFWDTSAKHASPVDIRCVVPGKDKDITPKANGEFKAGFKSVIKKVFGGYGKHLCFQASNAYNSWACFNFDKNAKPQSSFVQMNAD